MVLRFLSFFAVFSAFLLFLLMWTAKFCFYVKFRAETDSCFPSSCIHSTPTLTGPIDSVSSLPLILNPAFPRQSQKSMFSPSWLTDDGSCIFSVLLLEGISGENVTLLLQKPFAKLNLKIHKVKSFTLNLCHHPSIQFNNLFYNIKCDQMLTGINNKI